MSVTVISLLNSCCRNLEKFFTSSLTISMLITFSWIILKVNEHNVHKEYSKGVFILNKRDPIYDNTI